MKWTKRVWLSLLVAGLVTSLGVLARDSGGLGQPGSAEAASGEATSLYVPSQVCLPNGTVSLYLGWNPSQTGLQWSDLSAVGNGFQLGTFVTQGLLPPLQSSVTWNGLNPGWTYYARVNTLDASGWHPSISIPITTRSDCSVIGINNISLDCETNGLVQLTLSWNPTGAGVQQVELSSADSVFASFGTSSQLSPYESSFVWAGLDEDQTYFVRLDTWLPTGLFSSASDSGWKSSASVAFVTPTCLDEDLD